MVENTIFCKCSKIERNKGNDSSLFYVIQFKFSVIAVFCDFIWSKLISDRCVSAELF